MGTGFLEVNIQPYRGWEGWAAPRRLHVWCVCLRVRLFPVPSSSTSQKAAAQVAAHPAFAVREVVRVPGSVVSHRSLRIPDGTSCRPVRVQVAARTAAGVCGSCVSLFGGWGKTDETSTRSTGTGGGAGCCRGGVVPTTPTRELYVQGTQEHQLPGSNPRTGRLKTTALTTGPCRSLALFGVCDALGV